MRRSNRLGGGYQRIQEEPKDNQEKEELDQEPEYTEEDSVILRKDNLPIVDLIKYNTGEKEAKYIKINHNVGNLTANKNITEENNKQAEFEIILDLKTIVSKTAIDTELTRLRSSMRREDRETAPDGHKPVFEEISIRWGLVFVDDQIVVPIDLRRRLLDNLQFGHPGITKMDTEAKILWWPKKTNDIEIKVKNCTACLASGKNIKHQLPKELYGNIEKLTDPGQKIQIDFTGNFQYEKIHEILQRLIAVDRFSKWPTVKICKTSETDEVTQFPSSNFNLN